MSTVVMSTVVMSTVVMSTVVMSTVVEIEKAIERLSPDEFRSLHDWMTGRDAEACDRHFAADVATGKGDGQTGRPGGRGVERPPRATVS